MTLNKIDISGLEIAAITKKELLERLAFRIPSGKKTWVTTIYSEFLFAALKDLKTLNLLNKADIAVADGIGIFWAKRYLELPLTSKSFIGKIIQALWQIKYSLGAIIFNPRWIKSALPEKIVGADLVWDLAKMASENNFSIFLLGGFGNTSELTKQKLISQYPNIPISTSAKNPNDPSAIEDINSTSADMLLVAYGPIKQEQWIYENLPKLNIKFAMGVGGSFDYIAGAKSAPPKFVRYSGLEWLWRLFSQPYRLGRIFNATFGLINELLLYKIFLTLPYRKNVATVILNNKNEVLIVQRNPLNKKSYIANRDKAKYLNYWQFPQGGIDAGEALEHAAKREIQEETGLTKIKLLKISSYTNQYNFTPTWKRLWDRNYRYRGQLQNIVYFQLQGNSEKINLDQDEIINHSWTPVESLEERVHEERANLLKIALQDLKNITEE